MKYTIIESSSRLSKKYELSPSGSLIGHNGGALVDGQARVCSGTLEELANALDGLSPNQAVCWGIPSYGFVYIRPENKINSSKINGTPVIARNRKNFSFPNEPGILMLDIDPRPGENLDLDRVREYVYTLCPAIKQAPHIIRPSASSYIFHEDKPVKPCTGWRMLVLIANAKDCKRAGETLCKRDWLAGGGWIKVSKSGSLLIRCKIDSTVWQPERLDFCSGAECVPPLKRQPPETMVYNSDALPLDSYKEIPSLTEKEEKKYSRLVETAKKEVFNEAKRTREDWIEENVSREFEQRPREKQTLLEKKKIRRKYTEAVESKRLFGNFRVTLGDGSKITVAEICKNKEEFHQVRIPDPIEPEYRNDNRIAIIYTKQERPCIYSHAHGGRTYQLIEKENIVLLQPEYITENVAECVEILTSREHVYQREREIIYVSNEEFCPVDSYRMSALLNSHITFVVPTKYGTRTVEAPLRFCQEIISTAELKPTFPEIKALATAPLMNIKTGKIHDKPGYDKETGILYKFSKGSWPGVSENPTTEDVKAALNLLWEPFKDFPFVDSQSRGAHLSACLTACVRQLLCTSPAILYSAPTAGSGKTLLSTCVSILGGGKKILFSAASGKEKDEEMRKRIASASIQGIQSIILDNLSGIVDSPVLCAYLTSGDEYTERVLGKSELTSKMYTRTNLLLNGNNVQLKGDLCRRVLVARIDPNVEKPWAREFDFNPADYVRENRLKLVAASLTILRAARNYQAPTLGSFEDWSMSVRKAVRLAASLDYRFSDPVESINTAYDLDPETEKLDNFIDAVSLFLGYETWTTAELISSAQAPTENDRDKAADVRVVLKSICFNDISTKAVGKWLSKNEGRVLNGKKIVRMKKKRKRCVLWKITQVDK